MPRLTAALVSALLALGCPASSDPADSGDALDSDLQPDVGAPDGTGDIDALTQDGGETDGSPADTGETDAGEMDAVPPTDSGDDSAPVDAEVDANVDAEDPCATVGCSFPPMCGEACDAMCGCCACEPGGSCGGGFAQNCAGDCFLRTACGDSDCAVDGTTGVAFCGNCRTVQAQYDALTSGASTSCTGPDACQVVDGACGVGLGGCYHGVNAGVTQGQIDVLAAQWVALGCAEGAAVCDCAAPPSVRCDAGGCLLGS